MQHWLLFRVYGSDRFEIAESEKKSGTSIPLW